jgi:hypothetical protein
LRFREQNIQHDARMLPWPNALQRPLLSAITAAHVIARCRNAMPSESESHSRKGPFKTLESKIQQLRRAVAG